MIAPRRMIDSRSTPYGTVWIVSAESEAMIAELLLAWSLASPA